MATTNQIQRRLVALENQLSSSAERISRIVYRIINPDGSLHETIFHQMGLSDPIILTRQSNELGSEYEG